MITRKLSAVLTAALLTGALSATAFAAEPVNLADTDDSVIFKKAISLENATGSGGVRGTIRFTVTPALAGDIPTTGAEDGAQLGSVDQIETSEVSAVFTAADGKADTEQDVKVEFDLTKFTAPGVYYYRLTEQNHGIKGLSVAPVYLLKARVVNADPSDPDNTAYKIDYAVLASLSGNEKLEFVQDDYTTHALTVTKHLEGDFASYGDVFDFTLSFVDPNYVDDNTDAPMASVTVSTGTEGGAAGSETKLVFDKGKASTTQHIKGGQMIRVTGLPEGTTYTIEEKGTAADKYTTAWTIGDTTQGTGKKLENQKMTDGDTNLVVTNTRNAATPTGLLLDAAPYGAMLALAAGSGAVFFRKRRNGQ